jgi:hypothetical protein
MKFRQHGITLLICTICCTFLTAQSDLNISMKGGILSGDLTFGSKNITFSDNGGTNRQGNGSVAMAFSQPIRSKFRLGAEVGLNTYTQLADVDINFGTQATFRYLGDYTINQAYFAVVPEFRPLHWLFVNAGLAYSPDLNSNFTSGFRSGGSIVSSEDISGLDFRRFAPFAYFAGAGICPRLTKSLAVLAELRFTSSPASTDSPDQIAFGYRAFGFNLGLMYRPQE